MKKLTPILFLFMLAFSCTISTSYASFSVGANVLFGLSSYDTYITFDSDRSFSTIDVYPDKVAFDNFYISIVNGNCTISEWFELKRFVGKVEAPSGTLVTLTIHAYNVLPKKVYINNKLYTYPVSFEEFQEANYNCWMWNPDTSEVKVKIYTQSIIPVVIDWRIPEAEAPAPREEALPPTSPFNATATTFLLFLGDMLEWLKLLTTTFPFIIPLLLLLTILFIGLALYFTYKRCTTLYGVCTISRGITSFLCTKTITLFMIVGLTLTALTLLTQTPTLPTIILLLLTVSAIILIIALSAIYTLTGKCKI